MKTNPHVKHVNELIEKKMKYWILEGIDKFLDVMGEIALPSIPHTLIALIVPLILVPYVLFSPNSDFTKIAVILLTLFAQSWIQWWSLPSLQRLQVKADAKRDAKADVDHEALTHIANQVDKHDTDINEVKTMLNDFINESRKED
jgi:hypothetical protein